MSITAHSRAGGATGTMGRLPMLVPPLAALLYPFSLEGFHTSVTHIVASDASILSWLSAAACLALAFATPLIAILAAMSFSEIGHLTVAQLHAKRTALLAVAAPTFSPSWASFSPCCTIRCLTPGSGSLAGGSRSRCYCAPTMACRRWSRPAPFRHRCARDIHTQHIDRFMLRTFWQYTSIVCRNFRGP
jgi:hypothetical protein